MTSEEVVRGGGMLQGIDPLAKTVAFLSALVACSMARSALPLVILLTVVILLAGLSKVRLGRFLGRVGTAVIFFGAMLAIPVSLRPVTPGPMAFTAFGMEFSASGLNLAWLILLRLATGISVAILWHQTTRWFELLRTLRTIGVPQMFLTGATLSYRYLFVMIETLGEMVEARTARQVGACSRGQARAYAGAGTAVLFAKSMALTEEIHWSMNSRTCSGTTLRRGRPSWTIKDALFALSGVIALLLILWTRMLHAA